MTKLTIIFFGSFQHYSVKVLDALRQSKHFDVVGVVTTPPKPAGRDQKLNKTAVHQYAIDNNLPVFTPENLNQKPDKVFALDTKYEIRTSDLFIVAGYSKLLPPSWLDCPKLAALNVHFSLLPKYRGAMPAEWAILMGEKQTGVTLMEMSEKFDQGKIISQQTLTIDPQSTRETLYDQLYLLGARLTLKTLPYYIAWKTHQLSNDSNYQTKQSSANDAVKLYLPPQKQAVSPTSWARLLNKDDSFLPWPLIQKALNGQDVARSDRPGIFALISDPWPQTLERATRAFLGYPDLWTQIKTAKGQKRLKLLSSHIENTKLILDQVQLEGLSPTPYNQIKNQLLS